MKRAGLIISVVLLPLVLLLVLPLLWLLTTGSGLHWTYQQAQTWLPENMSLEKLEGKLIGPVKLTGIAYQQDGIQVRAEQINFDWNPLALLAAQINISRLHIQTLEIVLPETETGEPASQQDISLPDIHLPWRLQLQQAGIDGVDFRQGEQHLRLDQIRLKASSLFSRIDIKQLSLHAGTFKLNLQGKLQPVKNYRHELKINWQTTLPSSVVLKGHGQLSGDMQNTLLTQTLSGALQAKLDAQLNNLLKQPDWQARLDVTQFNSSQFDAALPVLSGALKLDANGDLASARVSGTLDAIYAETGAFDANFKLQRHSDNTIQIDQLKLRLPASDTSIDAEGKWQPGDHGGDFKLALNWLNLRWPMTDEAWFSSAIGNGSIEGNMDQYRIELTTDRPWPQAPSSTWTASAEGNLDGLDIHSLRVTALNGEAIASGQLSWSPVLKWRAEISASQIDPSSLWPEWPGRLSAELSSQGRMENGELVADADIRRLTGTLRNYPVALQSQLGWRNNGLDIERFDFHSGDARFSLEGRFADELQLQWSVAASKLNELYPQAEGELNASGRLSGPQQAPTVQASFKGSALGLPGYRLGALDGALSVDLFKWQQLDINLAVQALELNGLSLQSLNISSESDRIEAITVSDQVTAQIELRGKADAQGWHGRLERADFSSKPFHNWSLKTPVAINMTASALNIQPLCWISNDSKLCLTLQRDIETWQATLKASKMPMLLLGPWLPEDLKLEGKLDASAEMQLRLPSILLGQASLSLLPGEISYPLLEGERDRWEYRGGTVLLMLDDQGITTKSDIAMSNGDRFKLDAQLPGAQLLTLNPQQQTVRADAQLKIHDLGLIEALLPEVQDLKGEISLNLNASGTLAQPRLSGRGQLVKGSLRVPRLGLNINQLSLSSQSQNFETVSFRLDARSGEGNLLIQGQTTLDKTAGWPTEISIKGKEFEVSSIPEARVQVSPELKVKMKNRRLDIEGEVHIPYAKLQPKDITTASRVSDDAVIIGGEQTADEIWLLFTRIRLTLGERVSFYGFGFEGRLGGSLLLEDEPGQLTRATGEINVPEGRYRAYGQRLDVEHGRLLYTGGPLTNPGLDLRAVRHVGDVTAGIKVRGSLNQPQLELFSIPSMGQTDALAYLLLGGPIEQASGEEGAMMAKAALAIGLSGGDTLARNIGDRFGLDEMRVETSDTGDQASLVVGRYLSPKLYVSYGVGLVESFNTLTLRYKIADKWQLKAESGEYQGADILYTFER